MASVAPRWMADRYLRRRIAAGFVASGAAAGAALLISHAGTVGGGSDVGLGAAQDAAATVQQFDKALTKHDFKKICNDLMTASARRAAGGRGCPAQLAAGASSSLPKPSVRMTALAARGNTATATVVIGVAHQPAVAENLSLVRKGGAFKIAAFSSPPDD